MQSYGQDEQAVRPGYIAHDPEQPPQQQNQEEADIEEEYEQGYGTDDEVRHSYEYTRGRYEPRPDPLSRHASALSVVRSRNSAINRRRSGANGPDEDGAALEKKTTTREGFGHQLMHEKTSKDYLVDFDGKDDPYRPINWSFRKKAVVSRLFFIVATLFSFTH